jgi:hypothetical protein
MLSYACHYYIFNTENPFSSAGYGQEELLDMVIMKIFHYGVTRDGIRKAVALTVESNVDRYTLHIQLFFVLIGCLKSADAKEMAAEECLAYRADRLGKGFIEDGHFRIPESDSYARERLEEHCVELYFHLKMELCEYEEAIAYFHKNSKLFGYGDANNPRANEIRLYRLLGWLRLHECPKLWLAEYEKALKKNVEPRDSLQYIYRRLKQGLSFSETDD